MSTRSLTRHVGNGSKMQDFVGEDMISLLNSSSHTDSKFSREADRCWVTVSGSDTVCVENVALIRSIFPVKCVAKVSARNISESWPGNPVPSDLCRVLFSSCHSFPELSLFLSIASE